jgi:hypothetical protein
MTDEQSAEKDAPMGCVTCETFGPKRCGLHADLLITSAACGVTFDHDWHGYLDGDGRTRVCDGTPYVAQPAKCPDCGHLHTPDGCKGDSTASDLWAGVTPAACDCTRVLPPGSGRA